MSTIKSHKEDIIFSSNGDTIIRNNGVESARVHSTGVLSTKASTTNIGSAGDTALVSKEYSNNYMHSHSNTTVLNGITKEYTTAQESKLAGIEYNARPDMTAADITALNINAGSLDGASLSTATGLGTSNVLIPSQNAVKQYTDEGLFEHEWNDANGSGYHGNTYSAFHGYKTVEQAISHNVVTRVIWNAELFDYNYGLNTSTGIWVCPVGGYHNFSATVTMVYSTTWNVGEIFDVYIRKYSSGTWTTHFAARRSSFGTVGMAHSMNASGQMYVATNDQVDVCIVQRSGATLNAENIQVLSSFTGERIGYNRGST